LQAARERGITFPLSYPTHAAADGDDRDVECRNVRMPLENRMGRAGPVHRIVIAKSAFKCYHDGMNRNFGI
jgi:hypothetical protein